MLPSNSHYFMGNIFNSKEILFYTNLAACKKIKLQTRIPIISSVEEFCENILPAEPVLIELIDGAVALAKVPFKPAVA